MRSKRDYRKFAGITLLYWCGLVLWTLFIRYLDSVGPYLTVYLIGGASLLLIGLLSLLCGWDASNPRDDGSFTGETSEIFPSYEAYLSDWLNRRMNEVIRGKG